MPISQAVRAHIVTPELTYRGHELQIDEAERIAYVVDRQTGEQLLELHDAEWSMSDRDSWRVEGVVGPMSALHAAVVAANGWPESTAGERTVWSAKQACARCGSSVFPTPDYDKPK